MAPPLVSFVQQLTNWYVRLNRSRLKGQDGEEAASVALNGMYEVSSPPRLNGAACGSANAGRHH